MKKAEIEKLKQTIEEFPEDENFKNALLETIIKHVEAFKGLVNR